MVSWIALFVIVSVIVSVVLGISAFLYFVIRRHSRSSSRAESPDNSHLPLQLPSSQKPDIPFRLDVQIPLLSPLTIPPRACRRSPSPSPLLRSSHNYVTLPSLPPPPVFPAQIVTDDQPSHSHHAFQPDDHSDDASRSRPQTPSTASQISIVDPLSPPTSPESSALLSYHNGMRQAALTALRPLRRPQTPTIDFGSLPTFDVTSATPPNYSSGPSNTAPLLQSNSKSTSRMQVSPLPIRSPAYENPFANPPPQSAPAIPQQLDYFNCKPVPVPSTQVEQHPYRCKVSSPLSHSPYPAPPPCEGYPPSHVRSYWSPAITPAPLQSLTRPSSPSLDDAYDSPLSLFPYIAYESSSPILPLPTPPLSLTPTAALLDIKIYFSATHDLVKIRLPRSASLDELKSKAADRVSGAGWKALHVAKPGVDTRDPSDVAERDLDELDDEWRWRSWLTSAVKAERGSGLGKQRRIVIWAM